MSRCGCDRLILRIDSSELRLERANTIGKCNVWRLAAGVLGTLGADALSDRSGFPIIFAIIVAPFLVAAVGTWRAVAPDPTSVGFAFGELALDRRILTMTSSRSQYAFAVTVIHDWVAISVGLLTHTHGREALETW